MKKNENIIKKVQQYQNKRGVRYATYEGELYGFLKKIYALIFTYNLVFSVFYILVILVSSESPEFDYEQSMKFFYAVSISTLVSIAGLVTTMINKTRWIGRFISIIALAVIGIALYIAVEGSQTNSTMDVTRFLGMPFYYYWRHGIPALLGIVILGWMTLIDIMAIVHYNKLYKKLEDELYRLFRSQTEDTSDEKWQAFLEESVKESEKENEKGKKGKIAKDMG